MTLIRQAILGIIGLSAGFAVAGGVFSFITMLGIIPRLAARTHTKDRIYRYESAVILGGSLGNIWILYEIPLLPSYVLTGAIGLFSGIFVGCLAMALAEVLRVFPILTARISLKEGFPYVVAAAAIGKAVGTVFQYFF